MVNIPFSAKIEIIGVNPFVYLPAKVLKAIFKQAGRDKGKIPVRIKIEDHEFIQTLIKYSGYWRLYLNTPMRKALGKDVGDRTIFEISYDPVKRTVPMHPKLDAPLDENKDARKTFNYLAPSAQKEILRYISSLKNEETVDRNIKRAIGFLKGKQRLIARGKPQKKIP